MSELVPAVTVQPVLRALRAKGVDPTDILEALSVSPTVESNPAEMLDHRCAAEVWSAAAEKVGDPAFGLSVPALMGPNWDDVSEWAFRSAPTLSHAYARLARHRSLLHDRASLTFERDATQGRITHRVANGGVMPRPIADYIAAGCLLWGRQAVGHGFAPVHVELSGPPPASLAPYEGYFGTRVEFGFNHLALTLPASVLDVPLSMPDPRLGSRVREHVTAVCAELARGDGTCQRVFESFAVALVDGSPDLQTLAQNAGMEDMRVEAALAAVGGPIALQDALRLRLGPRFAAEPSIVGAEVPFLLGEDPEASPHGGRSLQQPQLRL